jgi:hypothetical protein
VAYPTTVDVSSVAGAPYTWGGAGFRWDSVDGIKTWATAYPLTYTLSVGEGWTVAEAQKQHYTLTPRESCRLAEHLAKTLAHTVEEAWQMNEGWADVWMPMLRVFEVLATAEALGNAATISKAEGWRVAEASSRAPQFNPQEGWCIGDDLAQRYGLSPAEGWSTAEQDSRAVERSLSESWHITDAPPVWSTTMAFLEAWVNAETMTHTWVDFLTFVEGWTATEAPANDVTRPFSETWRTAEARAAAATKTVPVDLHIGETATTRSTFQRLFAEACHLAERLSQAQIKAVFEALATDEAYLRNANAVISDLAFASGDLTVEQFAALVSSPAGYGPFSPFIPGELEYQKALVTIVLAGPLTAGRPRVNEWKLTVDVSDRTDGGTRTIPAAATFVPFKARFFAPPEVMVQLRGGSTGTPDVISITEAGFYVQINDAAGHPVASDVVWSAVGY